METLPDIVKKVGRLPMISHGISGVVFALSESHVIKKPIPGKREEEQIEIERQIYERLGPHPYITKYFGARDRMIVLERLKYPLRKHLQDLRDDNKLPIADDVVRWASQATQAIQYITFTRRHANRHWRWESST